MKIWSHIQGARGSCSKPATQSGDLYDFVDNLDEMLLPDLARKIEELSMFDVTSTRAPPGLLGSDRIGSDLRSNIPDLVRVM